MRWHTAGNTGEYEYDVLPKMYTDTSFISSPKFIQIHNLTPHSLLAACNDLKEINICAKLDKSPTADVDQSYNIMYQEIHKVMNKYTTMRTVKFAKHKHKKPTGSPMAS